MWKERKWNKKSQKYYHAHLVTEYMLKAALQFTELTMDILINGVGSNEYNSLKKKNQVRLMPHTIHQHKLQKD